MNYIESVKENSKIISKKVNSLYNKLVIEDIPTKGSIYYPDNVEYDILNDHKKECIYRLFKLFLQGKNMVKYMINKNYDRVYHISLMDQYSLIFKNDKKEVVITDEVNYIDYMSAIYNDKEYSFFVKEIDKLFIEKEMGYMKKLY